MLIWQNLPIYNLKPLLLKISSHIQSWKTIGQNMREITHRNQFSTWIKGNNCANLKKFIYLQSKLLLLNINSHTKFEGNRQKNVREHWNQFSTWIKGNYSVLIWGNLSIYNPKPFLLNINSYTKFEDNLPKNEQDRARKPIFYMNKGQ